MRYLLKHGHLVVDGNREFIDGALLIDDYVISEVFPQSNKISDLDGEYEEIDLKSQLVMPGFFDTHNHGIDMMGFDDAARQQLDKMSYEYAMDVKSALEFNKVKIDEAEGAIIASVVPGPP